MALDAGGLHLFLYRLYKPIYIRITRGLRRAQLLTDMIVGIVFQIFQREVLEFTFQLVKSQFVSQWGIEIGGLLADGLHH